MALPKKYDDGSVAPFDILPLNPLTTFVGYSNDVYQHRMLGGTYVVKADGSTKIGVYTDTQYFELEGSSLGGTLRLTSVGTNGIGMVPIVEYRADEQRMGCFEKVLDLLDALCILTSDRVNGLSQFVQNILWADNVTLDEAQKEEVKNGGWLFTKSDSMTKATIQYLTQQLDQTSAQALVDWVYEQILQITGTPARGKSTGGNTGQAIVLSNGWTIAETAAKNTEIVFKDSEFEFLKVILRILERKKNVDEELKTLRLSDIDIKFSRNKTDSILVKVQALQGQLDAGVDPLTAIKTCDLYSDPQQVWVDSKPYIEDKRKAVTEPKVAIGEGKDNKNV
jgi:SPP1 family phage portal protein